MSGDQITFDSLDFYKMWDNITKGVSSFVNGVLLPVGNFCANSEIALAFLSVMFSLLGVRALRRTIGSFGRGR